jgi:beta-galactosidase
MKDEYNALNPQRQPGPLVRGLGGRVEQYYALDAPVPVGDGTASIWAEQLSTSAPDVIVNLRYGKSNGWLDDQPAMITRKVGKGTIIYLGTLPDPNLMQKLMTDAAVSSGVDHFFGPLPSSVELCRRLGPGHTIYILINHDSSGQQITLPGHLRELLTGKTLNAISLEPQGVAIFVTEATR